jgi:hypothetical protein
MSLIIQAIEEWAARYEKNHRVEYPVGVMVPRVAIGAIRGGLPFSPSVGVIVAAFTSMCAFLRP